MTRDKRDNIKFCTTFQLFSNSKIRIKTTFVDKKYYVKLVGTFNNTLIIDAPVFVATNITNGVISYIIFYIQNQD